jgi:hypothetical protein
MRRFFTMLPVFAAFACLCLFPAEADPIFTVSGVHVDAQGASVTRARDAAFAEGRPKAWQIVFRRLTRQQDWSRQPQLDDTQLQRLIRDFTISNERRSTTRYVADLSYVFNPAAVARVLREANLAFAAAPSKPVLLIPLSPGFERGSAWTSAFIAPRFADSVVPFRLPIADVLDAQVLAHVNIEQASWLDIEPVALRVHATEAVLVLVERVQGRNTLKLSLKRIGLGEVSTQTTADVPIIQTAVATYPSAADAAVAAIAEMWKQKAAVDYSQRGKIVADVHINSLAQWGSFQTTLASVPNVTAVDVVAMNVGEARVSLSYLGTSDQLRDALAQVSLQLVSVAGDWELRPGVPPTTASQQTGMGPPPSHTAPAPRPARPPAPSHRP